MQRPIRFLSWGSTSTVCGVSEPSSIMTAERRKTGLLKPGLEKRVTTFQGKADNPLTSVEISEKARELMTPVLGDQRAVELIDTLSHLEELGSVRDLRPLLSA